MRIMVGERYGHGRTWALRSWPAVARLLGVTSTPRPAALSEPGGSLQVHLPQPVPCTLAPRSGAGTRAQLSTLPLLGTYNIRREA